MRLERRCLVILTGLLLLAAPLVAQTLATGSIAGVVKDTVELDRSDVAGRRCQPSKR